MIGCLQQKWLQVFLSRYPHPLSMWLLWKLPSKGGAISPPLEFRLVLPPDLTSKKQCRWLSSHPELRSQSLARLHFPFPPLPASCAQARACNLLEDERLRDQSLPLSHPDNCQHLVYIPADQRYISKTCRDQLNLTQVSRTTHMTHRFVGNNKG